MPEHKLFQIFLVVLEELGIPYMVTGAVASIVYGPPRVTHDIDLVVLIDTERAQTFVNAFQPEQFYCPPIEVVRFESKRPVRGHFNIIHHETGFKADVYLMGTDPLHRWGMSKRRRIQIGGGSFWIAPPEYVILRKLEYYREGGSQKHLDDIIGILDISSEVVDIPLILEKAGNLGLEAQWKAVLERRGHSHA
jgi:hypothetical protein